MKWIFKVFLNLHIFIYRTSGGKLWSSMRGFNVLLLTTTGRKTGKQRTTPLGYFMHNDQYLIIGSNGGMAKHPAWYHNLKANPMVELQVKDQKFKARAADAPADQVEGIWQMLAQTAPAYADYRTKSTQREIPLILLTRQ